MGGEKLDGEKKGGRGRRGEKGTGGGRDEGSEGAREGTGKERKCDKREPRERKQWREGSRKEAMRRGSVRSGEKGWVTRVWRGEEGTEVQRRGRQGQKCLEKRSYTYTAHQRLGGGCLDGGRWGEGGGGMESGRGETMGGTRKDGRKWASEAGIGSGPRPEGSRDRVGGGLLKSQPRGLGCLSLSCLHRLAATSWAFL